jgi:hypothetical protein
MSRTFKETYPPRWRFQTVREALVRLRSSRYRRDAECAEDALEHLQALEDTLLPPIPSIEEFVHELAGKL